MGIEQLNVLITSVIGLITSGTAAVYDNFVEEVNLSSPTTYRVHGYQNSGGNLSMRAYIRAIKLGGE